MKLASIICPVYNCEQYIEKCIQSIIDQTYSEWELIIVDDGSTDGSGLICDRYADKYDKIKVIHQKNGGISCARNVGLQYAIGEYIFFIDADDYFEEEFLNIFVHQDEKYDYVAGGYIQKNILNGNSVKNIPKKSVWYKQELKKNYKNEKETLPLTFVWGKRYKRNIINKYNLKFDETVSLGEDIRFNLEYLEYSEMMSGIENANIVHTFDGKSAVTKYYPDRLQNIKEECQKLEKFLTVGDEIYNIRYYYLELIIAHYSKHFEMGDISKREKKKKLRETYGEKYFRESLNYVIKNGTLDMRLKALCQKMYIPEAYAYLYKMILFFYKLRNKE